MKWLSAFVNFVKKLFKSKQRAQLTASTRPRAEVAPFQFIFMLLHSRGAAFQRDLLDFYAVYPHSVMRDATFTATWSFIIKVGAKGGHTYILLITDFILNWNFHQMSALRNWLTNMIVTQREVMDSELNYLKDPYDELNSVLIYTRCHV